MHPFIGSFRLNTKEMWCHATTDLGTVYVLFKSCRQAGVGGGSRKWFGA